jgi:hypothetical protein
LRFEKIAAGVIEPRFGDLAARAVVDADEQDFPFRHDFILLDVTAEKRDAGSQHCVRNALIFLRSLVKTGSDEAQSWRHFKFASSCPSRLLGNA